MNEPPRDRPERRYPILRSLFPPAPQPPRPDPQRRPGAPLPFPAPPPKSAARTGPPLGVAAPGELIDFMVYGTDEDGTPEVHLAFKEQVFSGVYLKLRFEPEGVRAIFLVRDASGRRAAKSFGPDLLARLAERGLRTTTVEIEEQEE